MFSVRSVRERLEPAQSLHRTTWSNHESVPQHQPEVVKVAVVGAPLPETRQVGSRTRNELVDTRFAHETGEKNMLSTQAVH